MRFLRYLSRPFFVSSVVAISAAIITPVCAAAPPLPLTSSEQGMGLRLRADPLLSVDLNRAEIVAKLMAQWQGDIAEPQRDSFRAKLSGLRADRLLAVSLVGSFDGVLEVLYGQEQANTALSVRATTSGQNASYKTLGDVTADLVYTPITPCRIVDTRTSSGGPGIRPAGSTTAFNAVAASFATQGGALNNCNIPAGAAAMAGSFAMLNASSLGFITLWAVDTPQPTAASGLFNPTSQQTLNSSAGIVPLCTSVSCTGGKQFNVFVSGALDVAFDVTGYFKAPGGTVGDITEVNTGTASTTGLSGGSTSGVATLTLAPSFKLPQSCAPNQIAKWSGSAWICAADDAGPANAFVQGGNTFSALGAGVASVLGNNDNRPLTIKAPQSTIKLLVDPANGDDGLRISYATSGGFVSPNTINGSRVNSVAAGITGATVAGGGRPGEPNQVTGTYGTVGGGFGNRAGQNSVVAGGDFNEATGFRAVVSGGADNIASGDYSTIAGGVTNRAVGLSSFAAGTRAKANHDHAFVWGSELFSDTTSTGPKQFVIQANGGIRLPGAGENQPGNAAKQSGTNMFTHVVPASGPCNSTGPFGLSRTAIDHPLTNDKPDAILVVTPSFGALSAGAPGYNKPVVVFYDDGAGFCPVNRWVISNPNGDLNMVAGMKFNVFVINP